MSKAKWIWYNGDYELYHYMLLSYRREEYGHDYPCMWHVPRPEVGAWFIKKFTIPKDSSFKVITYSKGMVEIDGRENRVNENLPVTAGEHTVMVKLCDIEAFPAFYINSEYIRTDESWVANAFDGDNQPVGFSDCFDSENSDPRKFPFEYKKISPVSVEETGMGKLYDFGRETYGIINVKSENIDGIKLFYGESRKEALDTENAVIRETLRQNDNPSRPARAFRYIFVVSPDSRNVEIEAEYEYLPIEDKGYFECDDGEIKKIWDICSYTFHLNSRECFLDGIKRDRWVWSGDAYQSFKINRYLYNDFEITERTITALLGKPPYKKHVNTINDYSSYLIIAVWEHYFASGNKLFLDRVYCKVKELYKFVISRLDENGYVVRRDGDWIFIDWGVLDKDGAHCAEQILLWQVYNSMSKLSAAMGEADEYSEKAEILKKKINADFWNEEKGAFIDSYESGKNFVSRQTNVFAVLFDFSDEKQTSDIVKNVFENETLPQITTPYFKLYELLALCKVGKIEDAQDYISSYWGGMLKLGATSIWEEYKPSLQGDEHLDMYGKPYGKSLCHAWGSGPILLLLKECAGVSPTSLGSETFEIRPNPGKYKSFRSAVPVRDGVVYVEFSDGAYKIRSTVSGGTFIADNVKTSIEPNKEYVF